MTTNNRSTGPGRPAPTPHRPQPRPLRDDDHSDDERTEAERLNRDPITGTPGAHPTGTGAGAVAGGLTGMGLGAVAGGPVGAAIGGAAGAIAGGLAGKGVAEKLDPTEEEAFWREAYVERPYADGKHSFDDYGPAYRYGWESWGRHRASGRSFDEVEPDLRAGWESGRSTSRLSWDKARDAARDSWQRVSARFGPADLRADDDGMAPDPARGLKQRRC